MKRSLAYTTATQCGNHDTDTRQATQYYRAVYEAGLSPVCPLPHPPLFLNTAIPEEHKGGIGTSWDLLRHSHVLVVCGSDTNEDVKNDIAVAGRLNTTVTTLDRILTVETQGQERDHA